MPLQIIREDITKMKVDAIVNTTDGMENSSRIYTADKVKSMIKRQKEKCGWEFLFIGANIDAVETAARYGIDKNRAVNYTADKLDTRILYEAVSDAVGSVRASKSLDADWCAGLNEDYESRGKKHK